MILAILQHTPVWVWGLLLALIALGLSQTRARDMGLTRITVLPAVMLGLSLWSMFGAFGALPMAFGAWVVGVLASLTVARRGIAVKGAAWRPEVQLLHVPGSWLPLVLIVALFSLKYFAGVMLAMHPALAGDIGFAAPTSLAYGAFSGLFLARALALRSLAANPSRRTAA